MQHDLDALRALAVEALGERSGRNPAVALAAAIHSLALPLSISTAAWCLALRAGSVDLSRMMETSGDIATHTAMAAEGERRGGCLPGDPAALWKWCLAQPQEVLLDLLAYVVALSINAVREKEDRRHCRRRHPEKGDGGPPHGAGVLDGSGWLPAPLRPLESTATARATADDHAETA